MKTPINTKLYITLLILFGGVFCCYNFIIYTKENSKYPCVLSAKASEGQAIWQQNNCAACHQLYGLGGYMGPDLTNVFSTKGKGVNYIKAFLNSGIRTMPKFNFSEKEKDALVAFLQEVDHTGYYPNHNASIQANGWVQIQYKE